MAVLLIKRKELDVDITVALVDGGRLPGHLTCVRQHGLCHKRDVVVTIRAVDKDRMQSASEEKVNVSNIYIFSQNGFQHPVSRYRCFHTGMGTYISAHRIGFSIAVRRGRCFNGVVWKHYI